MYALVVFESMFGNTEEIAKAVADGLSSRMEVRLAEVSQAPDVIGDEVALLVVGGPTHAFGMSRQGTRESAAQQAGRSLISTGIGIREWLDLVRTARRDTTVAATFDTRVAKPRLPGSAARSATRRLRRIGFRVFDPQSFWVGGTEGHLQPGEPDRARRWGEKLASEVGERGSRTAKPF